MSVHPKLTLIMKFIDSMNSSMEQDVIVVDQGLTKQAAIFNHIHCFSEVMVGTKVFQEIW